MHYDQWYDVIRLVLDMKQGRITSDVPVIDDHGRTVGRYETLGLKHIGDSSLIEQLVRWRNQNVSGYLDQRRVTPEATAAWVVDAATNPTRIATLIYAGETLVGKCGIVQMTPGRVMSDGLVRGERGGGIKFMHFAQISRMIWDFYFFQLEEIHSKVLSTNDAAQESCRRLGYDMKPYRSQALYRKAYDEGVVLEEFGEPSELLTDVKLDYYRLDREAFFRVVNANPAFATMNAAIQDRFLSAGRSAVDHTG